MHVCISYYKKQLNVVGYSPTYSKVGYREPSVETLLSPLFAEFFKAMRVELRNSTLRFCLGAITKI